MAPWLATCQPELSSPFHSGATATYMLWVLIAEVVSVVLFYALIRSGET